MTCEHRLPGAGQHDYEHRQQSHQLDGRLAGLAAALPSSAADGSHDVAEDGTDDVTANGTDDVTANGTDDVAEDGSDGVTA